MFDETKTNLVERPLWHEWIKTGDPSTKMPTDFQTYLEREIIKQREQIAELRRVIYGK